MTFKTIPSYPRKLKIINKRCFIVFTIILLFVLCAIFLLQISFYCLPILIKHKISKLCLDYERQVISGNLCNELCTRIPDNDFFCPTSIYKDDALFMFDEHDEVLVFKEASSTISRTEILAWQDNLGYKHYPKEEEFLGMIRRFILFKYNKTLDNNEVKSIFNTRNGLEITEDYMNEIWQLVQDNEFMLITLSRYTILPLIYGTCGTIYATQKADSLDLPRYYNAQDYKKRIILAIHIIDFLYILNNQDDPLSLCDLSLNSFGRVNNRLKLISLKHVHPVSIVDRKLSDGRQCSRDIDCCYKNCLTKCYNYRCVHKQLNNNFQILCNKIFKGTNYRPGLLITSSTPHSLLELIDRCASPLSASDSDRNRPFGASLGIVDEIYALLTNIYAELTLS